MGLYTHINLHYTVTQRFARSSFHQMKSTKVSLKIWHVTAEGGLFELVNTRWCVGDRS